MSKVISAYIFTSRRRNDARAWQPRYRTSCSCELLVPAYCVLEFMQSVLAFRFLEHKRNVVRFEDVVFAEEE